MKILMLISHFPPKWIAGAEIGTLNLSKSLVKKGVEVHVVTRMHKELPRYERYEGIHIHRIWYIDWSILKITYYFSAFFKILKLDPDIIHGHMIFPNGFISIISTFFKKKPVITHCHGSDVYKPSSIAKLLKKFILWRSDVILVQSQHMKEFLDLRDRQKVLLFPNGVDLSKFNHKDQSPIANNIAYVGRITPIKGIKYLICALKYVKKNIKNINLSIVGDGEEKPYIQKLIHQFDLSDNVQFLGNLEHEKVFQIMASSCLLVLPSLSEGLPNVLLEAMASGTPVIATNVGGMPEVIINKRNGFIIQSKEPKKIAEKIVLICKNPDYRKEISKNNLKDVKNYSISHVSDELIKIYTKLK